VVPGRRLFCHKWAWSKTNLRNLPIFCIMYFTLMIRRHLYMLCYSCALLKLLLLLLLFSILLITRAERLYWNQVYRDHFGYSILIKYCTCSLGSVYILVCREVKSLPISITDSPHSRHWDSIDRYFTLRVSYADSRNHVSQSSTVQTNDTRHVYPAYISPHSV